MRGLLPLLNCIPVRIDAKLNNKIATGFLMSWEANPLFVLLVTNKHVTREADSLVLSLQITDSVRTVVGYKTVGVPLYTKQGDSLFAISSELDLALRLLPLSDITPTSGTIWHLNPDLFVSMADLYATQRVVFLGYPMGQMVHGQQPIVRSGMIAAVDTVNQRVLLDAQAFGGSSGSPVFLDCGTGSPRETQPCGRSKIFVGIIAGYLPYQKRLVNIETKQIEMIQSENSGLAVVVPAHAVVKLARSMLHDKTEDELN